MKNNGSQPSLGTKMSFMYLKSIYIYRIQKFWGHMLRRHSNPTKKQGLVAPANQAFGRFWTTVFTGFYGFG